LVDLLEYQIPDLPMGLPTDPKIDLLKDLPSDLTLDLLPDLTLDLTIDPIPDLNPDLTPEIHWLISSKTGLQT
jgi:hypothetical protein